MLCRLQWHRRMGNSIKTIYLSAIGLLLSLPLLGTLYRIIYYCFGFTSLVWLLLLLLLLRNNIIFPIFIPFLLPRVRVCVCVRGGLRIFASTSYFSFDNARLENIFGGSSCRRLRRRRPSSLTFLYVHRACVWCVLSARAFIHMSFSIVHCINMPSSYSCVHSGPDRMRPAAAATAVAVAQQNENKN